MSNRSHYDAHSNNAATFRMPHKHMHTRAHLCSDAPHHFKAQCAASEKVHIYLDRSLKVCVAVEHRKYTVLKHPSASSVRDYGNIPLESIKGNSF